MNNQLIDSSHNKKKLNKELNNKNKFKIEK